MLGRANFFLAINLQDKTASNAVPYVPGIPLEIPWKYKKTGPAPLAKRLAPAKKTDAIKRWSTQATMIDGVATFRLAMLTGMSLSYCADVPSATRTDEAFTLNWCA